MSRIKLSDGSTWPRPALESDDEVGIGWKLTHAPDQLTRPDLLEAASIVAAYGELVYAASREKRNLVCREVRQAMREEA